MCGIYGRVLWKSRRKQGIATERRAARRAQRQLRHRGPDSEGLWQARGTTLAHTRLKIIDLSEKAAQPMTNEGKSVGVTCNGEIYNYKELRRELLSKGHLFRSESDNEVIVHGYEQWGEGVVERLDGMFAFGIWDADNKKLILARDRTGKKPLFYHVAANGDLTFASEIKALGAASVPLEPDLRGILDFLVYGYVPAPRTFYQSVFQLPPASYLTATKDQIGPFESYWRPSFQCPPSSAEMSLEQAAEKVRRLTLNAVRRRLISDVPLGAFLSGGIDSSIVVGLMSQILGPGVKTFSIGFSGDPRFDETQYARLAARAFQTDHTEFILKPQSFELVEKLVWLHDGPFGDSSAIPTYMVSKLTREHVTVALTGDGGDEIFAGYLRLYAAAMAERLPSSAREALHGASRLLSPKRLFDALPGSERLNALFHSRSLPARAARFMNAVALPLPERILWWQNLFAFRLDELLRREVFAGVMPEDLFEFQHGLFHETRGQTPLARVLDHNFRAYLPYDLQVKMDRCSMANALEARSPFLDTELIEGMKAVPDRFKLRRGVTKFILKHAFRDLLPAEIVQRGKMGFGIPLGQWFRTDLRDYVSQRLMGEKTLLSEYLDPRTIERYCQEHMSGRVDWGHQLWALLTMEVWLDQLRQVVAASVDA